MTKEISTEHQDMLARAKVMMGKLEVERKGYKGPCYECKFYYVVLCREMCAHPIPTAASLLIDQGTWRNHSLNCDQQRRSFDLKRGPKEGEAFCGPNGLLFEPKKGFWRRILRFLT